MARPSNLSSMSVEALLKLRDDIGATLSRKADELKGQLSRLTGGGDVGGGRKKGRATKGRKVAAKYQDSEGNTWAGRGAQPRSKAERSVRISSSTSRLRPARPPSPPAAGGRNSRYQGTVYYQLSNDEILHDQVSKQYQCHFCVLAFQSDKAPNRVIPIPHGGRDGQTVQSLLIEHRCAV